MTTTVAIITRPDHAENPVPAQIRSTEEAAVAAVAEAAIQHVMEAAGISHGEAEAAVHDDLTEGNLVIITALV